MPTLGEFIQRVTSDHGVKVMDGIPFIDVKVVDENSVVIGSQQTDDLRYFERNVNGREVYVTVPVWPEDKIIQPTKLRQLCRWLEIPLEEFGLILDKSGFKPAEDDD